jgi:hypothetical protein
VALDVISMHIAAEIASSGLKQPPWKLGECSPERMAELDARFAAKKKKERNQ